MAKTIHATEIKNTVGSNIRIVTETMPPFQYYNDDNLLTGLGTELVHKLLFETKQYNNIEVMPWARAYKIALTDPNTLIFAIARTPEREKLFHWVGDIDKQKIYYWGLKEKVSKKDFILNGASSFIVGASRNSNIEEYLKQREYKNIYPLVNEDHGLNMLFLNRIELFVESEVSIKYRAASLGYDSNQLVKLAEIPELNQQLCIALSLKTPLPTVKYFQNQYKKLKSEGTISKIQNKWASFLYN